MIDLLKERISISLATSYMQLLNATISLGYSGSFLGLNETCNVHKNKLHHLLYSCIAIAS